MKLLAVKNCKFVLLALILSFGVDAVWLKSVFAGETKIIQKKPSAGDWVLSEQNVHATAETLVNNSSQNGKQLVEYGGFGPVVGYTGVNTNTQIPFFGFTGLYNHVSVGTDLGQGIRITYTNFMATAKFNVRAGNDLADSEISGRVDGAIGSHLGQANKAGVLDVYVGFHGILKAEGMLNPNRYHSSFTIAAFPESGLAFKKDNVYIAAGIGVGAGTSSCKLLATAGDKLILFDTDALVFGTTTRFIVDEKVAGTFTWLNYPELKNRKDKKTARAWTFNGFYTLNEDWTLTAGCDGTIFTNQLEKDDSDTPTVDESKRREMSYFQTRIGIIRKL